jgi:tetratricopeptide (TPR) repeat protein
VDASAKRDDPLRQFVAATAGLRHRIARDPRVGLLQVELDLLLQQGNLDEAERVCKRMAAAAPERADVLYLQGIIAEKAGRRAESIQLLRSAAVLAPVESSIPHTLGDVLTSVGRLDEAVIEYERALELKPDSPILFFNLGIARQRQGEPQKAETAYRRAIALNPDHAAVHSNLGQLLLSLGRCEEAVETGRRALELDPDLVEAQINLGAALAELGQLAEACSWYRRAIRARPDFPSAHNNLGAALVKLDRVDEAVEHCRRAITLKPDYAQAHYNLGAALEQQGQFAAARASYDKAIALAPDLVDAQWNRALALLRDGDWVRGWPAYEWRWRRRHQPPRNESCPLWRGEPLAGHTILLHAEQGIGDTIQFVRYVPDVAASGVRIVLAVQQPLRELMTANFGRSATIITRGDVPPPYDVQCPLLSLPLAFGTTLDSIPCEHPYLSADPIVTGQWRDRIGGGTQLKVGLAWAGSSQHVNDHNRSVAFAQLLPLHGTNAQWFSLQVGERADDVVADPFKRITNHSDLLTNFAETAGMIACLDLIVSVDTAVAHLAGALGKPVWLLVPFVPDWRWLTERDDSPWYPTLRLFRQREHGDWREVIQRVCAALSDF